MEESIADLLEARVDGLGGDHGGVVQLLQGAGEAQGEVRQDHGAEVWFFFGSQYLLFLLGYYDRKDFLH